MDVIAILRAGEIVSKRGDVLEHVGCIVGCLGSYMKSGLNEGVTLATSSELPQTVEACCDAIEAEQSRTESTELPEDKAFGVSPIMFVLIARLVKLLLEEML